MRRKEEAFAAHERNRVYSTQLKQRAVRKYLLGTGSLLEISKKYKIRDSRQLSNWLKVYTAHGDFNSVKQSGGGIYMKQVRGNDTGRTNSNRQRLYRMRQELRRDGTEISGQLPAGAHMDAAL